MWCEYCQSDVAAEISPETQTLTCTTCGSVIQKVAAPSLHPETQAARALLERWQKEQRAAKAPPQTQNETSADSEDTPPASAPVQTAEARKVRVDGRHPALGGPMHGPPRSGSRRPLEPAGSSSAVKNVPEESPKPQVEVPQVENHQELQQPRSTRKRRIDHSAELLRGPHFPVPASAPHVSQSPGRTESLWGQVLAYAGVGVLTFGTVLVLWGYFGGIASYSSTGWLLTTAGQMLLMLGVVTLVAGGMQQTTHEVGQRIDHLGGRIIRIENSTRRILKRRRSRMSHTTRSASSSAESAQDEVA